MTETAPRRTLADLIEQHAPGVQQQVSRQRDIAFGERDVMRGAERDDGIGLQAAIGEGEQREENEVEQDHRRQQEPQPWSCLPDTSYRH